MKSFYTLLAAVFLSLSAVAATPLKPVTLPGRTLSQDGTHKRVKSAKLNSLPVSAVHQSITAKAPTLSRKAPAEGWAVMEGTATVRDGLFDCFTDCPGGATWTATVEENTQEEGWYRLVVYGEGSSLADMFGEPDSTYMYINATDPDKVYCEDVTFFGNMVISQLVPDNDWANYECYGVLDNGNLCFPAGSFAYFESGTYDYYLTNREGLFQVTLPGHEQTVHTFADYSFEVTSPLCADNNKMDVSFTLGADVALVKYLTAPAVYDDADDYKDFINETGIELEGNSLSLDMTDSEEWPAGPYSVMAVALNDTGKVVATAVTYLFCMRDNGDDWNTLGSTTFQEFLYYPLYGMANADNTLMSCPLTCDIQEQISRPGRYRLVNPYAEMPEPNEIFTHEGHNHYLYINATDPAYVYIEASPLGIDWYDGEGCVWSRAAEMLDQFEIDAQTLADYGMAAFGTLEDNTLTFPISECLLGEKNYSNGEFFSCDPYQTYGNMVITLPVATAIKGITNRAAAHAEYYNLQGIRTHNPRHGLYIQKGNGKVAKVLK